MRLSAIHNETNTLVQISDISEISEIDADKIYISGKGDPRKMTVDPLTVSYDGTIMLKVYKIELETNLYHDIELTY